MNDIIKLNSSEFVENCMNVKLFDYQRLLGDSLEKYKYYLPSRGRNKQLTRFLQMYNHLTHMKDNDMIGTEGKDCLICGTPAKYIEVCSEAHFCSDECVDKFYKQVSKFESIGTDFEERLNRISKTYQITNHHTGCWLSNFEEEWRSKK